MALPDGVSDILPLTPVQTGMLFHVLEAPKAQGRYVAVLSCALKGALDAQRFRVAMQSAVQARDAYLAGFVWKGVKQPVQVIHKSIDLPWEELDWRSNPAAESDLAERVENEQTRQFDLKKPPLMAVTLVRLAKDQWQLIWTIHHLISDGSSTSAVLRDVFALYETPARNAAQSATFKDYVAWLKTEAPRVNNAFWSNHLQAINGPCALPRRIGVADHEVHLHHKRALGRDLLSDVETLARRLRITTHAVLSGTWALTLRKMLQENDVIFGQTTSGRPVQIPGIATAAGAFINTLPLRAQIDPDTTVETFLKEHARVQQDIAQHEFTALAEVQRLAPIAKGSALFDTVFVNEGVQQENFDFGDLQLTDLRTLQSSNYAATMLVTPHGDFHAELYSDPAKLSTEQAEQCLRDYEVYLRALVAHPQSSLRDLVWFEKPAIAVPKSQDYEPVLERFLAQAKASPNALAVSDAVSSFTYAALSHRARQYAHQLMQSGVAVEDIVPVALPRGGEAVAAFLGVMMVGAAYVPIDMTYPTARIAQILEAVDAKHIIAAPETVDAIGHSSAQVLLNSELSDALELSTIKQGSLAYVIFTSGSQGKPKGVEITQSALAVSTGVRDTVYEDAPDAFLLLSSLAFDSSVVGLYWTLATGGHLVIAKSQAEQQPKQLGALMLEHKITHTLCLPSLAQALIAAIPKQNMRSLKVIIAAGEALPESLVQACQTNLPECCLINEYGPTETTVWCSAFDATGFDAAPNIPIGTALPGTWVGIVDIDGLPVKTGEIGEIVVAGPTLARGYLNDPIQTKERFSDLGPNGPRVYRTGDLGSVDRTGVITYLGRRDKQIKIRGFRVELSEIEAAALSVSRGSEVVALASNAAPNTSITLFVESKETADLSAAIEQHLTTSLPAPFQPSRILYRETFPRLPNGKIDNAALFAQLQHTPITDDTELPSEDLELSLAEIYEDVLGVTALPRTAHFFDLGGDSLKTLAVYAKAQERGLPLQPSDLFEYPTIKALAAHIRTAAERGYDAEDNGVVQHANRDGKGTPVFFVHGSLRLFNQVVQGAGRDTPVMLQFKRPLLATPAPFGQSIEQLAATSIALLQKQHPKGPYILCGFSIGCAITMEIANQLASENVTSLILLDPPYDMIGTNPELQNVWSRTKKRWHIIARRWFRVRRFKPRIARAKARFEQSPNDVQIRHDNFDLAYIDALARYFIPKYTGKTEIYYTDVNTSLEPGDVMDSHFPNKSLIHLDVSHDGLIDDPEGIIPISKAIIANC